MGLDHNLLSAQKQDAYLAWSAETHRQFLGSEPPFLIRSVQLELAEAY